MTRRRAVQIVEAETSEYRQALDQALALLARRSRSRAELSSRLRAKGLTQESVEQAEARLVELGLLDDLAFAREYVRAATCVKGCAPARLRKELAGKGFGAEIAEQALHELEGSGWESALELARRHAPSCTHPDPVRARRRLAGYLGRAGYDEETVEEACLTVLPPGGPAVQLTAPSRPSKMRSGL
ncbi:MAG: regulatory protein RecX [Actinomycetota bacterium]